MARSLIWGLGGASMAAAASVAGYIVLNAPGEPVGEASPEAQSVVLGDGDAVTAADQERAPAAPPEDPVAEVDEDAAQPPRLTFDVVRVARDGNALVAGQASPGAQVELRVDDQIVARSMADASGQFVAMFDLGPSEAAQMMTLSMQRDGEAAVMSPDQVILTPRPAEVASADPVELAVLEDSSVPAVDVAIPDAVEVVANAASDAETAAVVGGTTEAPLQVVPEQDVEPMPESVAEVTAQAVDGSSPAVEAFAEAITRPEPDVSLAATESSEPTQGTVQVTEPQVARADTEVHTEIAQTLPPETEPTPEPIAVAQAELAAEMPTALLVRGTGEVELLDRAPQVMDNVVIDTISYTAVGDVQIAGRASGEAPQANLRIYLNNMPIAVARSSGGGWASDLPDVDPGVYTLRVDQLNDTGGVVSRFETPFQREDPERVLAARARAAGPANAQTVPADATPPSVQGDEASQETVAQVSAPDATDVAVAEVEVTVSAQTEPSAPVAGLGDVAPTQSAPATQEDEIAEIEAAPVEAAPVETVVVEGLASEAASPEAYPVAMAAAEAELPSEPVPAQTAAVEVAQAAPEPVTPAPPISLITVQPGATLWAISRERYGAGELYVQIYRANRSQIRNPDLIYPGQIFNLPD